MRAAAGLLAALALAPPATARAAAFGELPVLPLASSGRCLSATGAPGELVRSSAAGAHFMRLSAGGISDGETVVTGVASGQCPQVAARPSGAGVVAQAGAGLWVATRDPGSTWSTPVSLSGGDAGPAADAVASSGAAVVAWTERSGTRGYAVKVARRAPGGAFGDPVTLVTGTTAEPDSYNVDVHAGIADDGEALVAWTAPGSKDVALEAAVAPPGGAFGPVQDVATLRYGLVPSLAEAPDGRALLAFASGQAIEVAERAPGQAFAAPAAITTSAASAPSAAIGAGGAATVAWGDSAGAVHAVTRAGAGRFGAPVTIATAPALNATGRLTAELYTLFSGSLGVGLNLSGAVGQSLRTAVTAGSALVSWTSPYGSVGARYATLPLGGGHLDHGALGASLRDVDGTTPVLLADGRTAFAWSDRGSGGPRLHAAVEGAADPAAPHAPVVTVGRPLATVLRAEQALELPVHCSAACDVAVTVEGELVATAYVSLRAAGNTTLVAHPDLMALAPARRGPVRLDVRSGAPGAAVAQQRELTVTLSRAKHKPGPHVGDATAVRRGDDVVVRWHSGRTADPESFLVAGGASRDFASTTALGDDAAGRHGRYSARIKQAAGVRYVTVLAGDDYGISSKLVVKVK